MHLNRAPSWESAWPVLKWRLILIMRCVSWRPKRESVSIDDSHVKKGWCFSFDLTTIFPISVEFWGEPTQVGRDYPAHYIHSLPIKESFKPKKQEWIRACFSLVFFCSDFSTSVNPTEYLENTNLASAFVQRNFMDDYWIETMVTLAMVLPFSSTHTLS